MTLQQAIDTLNRNRFWGYETWHTEERSYGTVVVGVPGGYPIGTDTAIGFAIMHPHDNGRENA